MTRILAFTPYAAWEFHTRYEVTISKAARLRGAQVRHILCDGQMAACDMYGAAASYPQGRPLDLCQQCQTMARAALEKSSLPFEWMSTLTTQDQKREAILWAQNLAVDELENARFHDWPLGEWITTSVVSYFREYPLDFNNWHHLSVWRGFLQGAAISALAIDGVLNQWQPDVLLMFNGRFGPLRVAFNLARARQIRVLIHERPWRPGAIFLYENAPANSPRPPQDYVLLWRDAPLTIAQLQTVQQWLIDRRFPPDRGLDLLYANTPQGAHILKSLGLTPEKKFWVMLTSSTDEFMGDPAIVGPFETQESWIEGVLAWMEQRPDIQLVIRVHPNVGGAGLGGESTSQALWFEHLRERLPANVTLIGPNEPLSSYDLMDACDAALTYGTTAGLEALASGKPVLTVPPLPLYAKAEGVLLVEHRDQLEAKLEELARHESTPPTRARCRRGAFRCIYRGFFDFQKDFPLVRVDDRVSSRVTYSDESALLPGRDATLDRICDFLFDGRPLFDAPTPADLALTNQQEDDFFAALEANENWLKPRLDRRRLTLRVHGARKESIKSAKNMLRPLKNKLGL